MDGIASLLAPFGGLSAGRQDLRPRSGAPGAPGPPRLATAPRPAHRPARCTRPVPAPHGLCTSWA